jgi:putative transposase
MIYPVVEQLAADGIAVAVTCRVLGVSTSGFYHWRVRPVSVRRQADEALVVRIRAIHQMSRGTYGSPRVHAELRHGAGVRCGRKRVERLMRTAGLQGIYRRRGRGCTRRDPAAQPATDLVQRRLRADRPDALWVTDITQHRTGQGWVYCAVVLDVFARRVVGWSIADHLRTELVIDALDMARWRRRPVAGQTVIHSDPGWCCRPRSTTNNTTPPPQPRPDRHTRAVRQTGGSSHDAPPEPAKLVGSAKLSNPVVTVSDGRPPTAGSDTLLANPVAEKPNEVTKPVAGTIAASVPVKVTFTAAGLPYWL